MIRLRNATKKDSVRLAEIYSHYVQNTTVTFETDPPTAEEMSKRIGRFQKTHAWLVAEVDGVVQGYAYGSPFKERAAYRYSAELTVYVDKDHCCKGIGKELFGELLGHLRLSGYVQAIGGIALPNPASVRLHEQFGFEKVANFKQVGFKLGKWIDVGYWQKQIRPFVIEGKSP